MQSLYRPVSAFATSCIRGALQRDIYLAFLALNEISIPALLQVEFYKDYTLVLPIGQLQVKDY